MKIKTLVLTGLVLTGTTAAYTLKANSVELYTYEYSYGGGGEITAISSPSFLSNYSPLATVNGGFETFCTEVTVNADAGVPYSFNLANSTTEGDALSLGAAYLYYLFGTGALPGYNYADAAGSPFGPRISDAEELQSAIWALMNQPNYFGQDLTQDPYLALAFQNFNEGALSANNGVYPVEVMQLWDADNIGSPGPLGYQNQLVIVSVPDTVGVPDGNSTGAVLAGSCLLLGGFGWQIRRKNC